MLLTIVIFCIALNLQGQKVSFSTPLNTHGSAQSGVVNPPKSSSLVLSSSSLGATKLHSTVTTAHGNQEAASRHKEGPSANTEESTAGAAGGCEAGEAECSNLQSLLVQQLSQHRRVSMAGLGKSVK